MFVKNFLFLISYIFSTYCVKTSVSLGRIVGGEKTTAVEYPFVVSLRFRDRHICGGTIVSNRYILTAAHCLVRISPLLLTVIAGRSSQYEIGDVYFIQFPIVHTFNVNNGTNDIALLRTTYDIRYNDKVQAVELFDRDIPINNNPVTMVGWGRIKYGGPAADYLQKVKMHIVDYVACKRVWNILGDGQICVGSDKRQGSCMGDSGGPIIADDHRQIGIISYGKMCAEGKPDVATRVSHYFNWIRNYVLF